MRVSVVAGMIVAVHAAVIGSVVMQGCTSTRRGEDSTAPVAVEPAPAPVLPPSPAVVTPLPVQPVAFPVIQPCLQVVGTVVGASCIPRRFGRPCRRGCQRRSQRHRRFGGHGGQVLETQVTAFAQGERPMQEVLQFPDIAGKWVLHQLFHGPVRQERWRNPRFPGDPLHEALAEQWQVLATLA